MKKNKGFIDAGVIILMILLLLMLMSMVLSIKQDSSFEEKCRKEGGVPVQTFSSTNCAAEGYIDINLK